MGRTIDTKANITAAFLKLYSKKPVEDIRVMDICDACEISRGTFYYHFADVLEVCEEVENSIIADVECSSAVKEMPLLISRAGADDVGEFFDKFLLSMEEHRKQSKTTRILLNGSHGKIFISKWTESIRKNNIKCFVNTNLTKEQQEWTASFVSAGLVNLLIKWVENDCKDDPMLVANVYAGALFRGSVISEINKKTDEQITTE